MKNETLKAIEAIEEKFKIFKDSKFITDFLNELKKIKDEYYSS